MASVEFEVGEFGATERASEELGARFGGGFSMSIRAALTAAHLPKREAISCEAMRRAATSDS